MYVWHVHVVKGAKHSPRGSRQRIMLPYEEDLNRGSQPSSSSNEYRSNSIPTSRRRMLAAGVLSPRSRIYNLRCSAGAVTSSSVSTSRYNCLEDALVADTTPRTCLDIKEDVMTADRATRRYKGRRGRMEGAITSALSRDYYLLPIVVYLFTVFISCVSPVFIQSRSLPNKDRDTVLLLARVPDITDGYSTVRLHS